jgi:hypothetical protein
MATEKFANFPISTLGTQLNASTQGATDHVFVALGSKFPSLGDFRILCEAELMKATARAGNDITVLRGAEGTSPVSHTVGKTVTLVLTQEVYETFVQRGENLYSTPAATASAIATAVSTHEGLATDIHPQYQKESEKAVANGYASLDVTGKVPSAQLPTITGGGDPTLAGDVTGLGSANVIAPAVVSNGKIRNSVGVSVMGRSANSTGTIADIVAASDDLPLRRNSGVLAFGALNAALALSDGTVSDVKLANRAAVSVMGRSINSGGPLADIAATADDFVLGRRSGVLTFAKISVNEINDNTVTYAKMQNVVGNSRLLGRFSGANGDPEEISLAGLSIVSGALTQYVPLVYTIPGDLVIANGLFQCPLPFNGTVVTFSSRAHDAPTGSIAQFDLTKNNTTSVFSTRPQIAAGGNNSTAGTLSSPDFVSGDYIQLNVTAIGNTAPGSNVTVFILLRTR